MSNNHNTILSTYVNEELNVSCIVQLNEDGRQLTTFMPIKKQEKPKNEEQNLSLIGRIVNWFRKSKVKPYVSITDLNNISDDPAINKPVNAVEIGVKIEF